MSPTFGRLLCRLGWHQRRFVHWAERGTVRLQDGTTTPYSIRLTGYRCQRCEPVEDITNDPIILPRAMTRAGES